VALPLGFNYLSPGVPAVQHFDAPTLDLSVFICTIIIAQPLVSDIQYTVVFTILHNTCSTTPRYYLCLLVIMLH